MKKFVILIIGIISFYAFANNVESKGSNNTADSLDIYKIPPLMGEQFIRYMHPPDKRRPGEEPKPQRYYVLEVSTDVMENGERRAMPFIMLERGGEEYFVAFEVVTSFETEEEVLKYAEEHNITDIDIKDYSEDVPNEENPDN